MATQVDEANEITSRLAAYAEMDTSGWTERQRIQFRLGMWDGIDGHPVTPREVPEWTWEPNDEWQKGRGMLADHPWHDTTAARRADREWEMAHDERKFGPSRNQ